MTIQDIAIKLIQAMIDGIEEGRRKFKEKEGVNKNGSIK